MNRLSWKFLLGASLLIASVLFYYLHYLLFKDAHHIFIFLIGDIAFVFVEVLLVTLIIHRVLEEREKKARLEKLNMVIGTFYSEVGTKLLQIVFRWDTQIRKLQQEPVVERESAAHKFERIRACLETYNYELPGERLDWDVLKMLLITKRPFFLRLLENPHLLEHEAFTDLLWAVFHLAEELEARESLQDLSPADRQHLRGDLQRVYGQLALQWLKYMEHLKVSYPYLFSLSLRTNPFDPNASPVVQE